MNLSKEKQAICNRLKELNICIVLYGEHYPPREFLYYKGKVTGSREIGKFYASFFNEPTDWRKKVFIREIEDFISQNKNIEERWFDVESYMEQVDEKDIKSIEQDIQLWEKTVDFDIRC